MIASGSSPQQIEKALVSHRRGFLKSAGLLEMASARLGVPTDQLPVSDAVVSVKAEPSKRVTYGELIAGEKFNVTLTGDNVYSVTGKAKTKSVPELKYPGQSLQRDDIPAK